MDATAGHRRLLFPCGLTPTQDPMNHCIALVVGAGPVGLALASQLHRHGVACRIIDRSPTPSTQSKALVLWPRTLEMLDQLGLADAFVGAGRAMDVAHIYGSRRTLVRLRLDLPDTHFPHALMLAQSETERLLHEHLSRVGIPVGRQIELTGLADCGAGVEATLRHADGRDEVVRCEWLLGCDGAHSTVRKAAGIGFAGEAEPNDWVLADCRVDGPLPLDELSLFWHARGVLAFFPFAPGRCRVIADRGSAAGQGRPADPTLADVQALVDARGPGGVRLSEPHWLSGFRIHERKVADYRRGRVFLVGDAAHIHSPAGGQGMNTGMQDAWNLAWKLALVQSGAAAPQLLDSYGAERGRVGEQVLRNAARLTWVATLRNPLARAVRNAAVALAGRVPALRRAFVRGLSELAIRYPDSPLNGESSGRRWAAAGARPGDRVPDVPLDQTRLHVVLRGPRLQLVLLPAEGDSLALPALSDVHARLTQTYPGLAESHLVLAGAAPPAVASVSTWHDATGAVRRVFGAHSTAIALVRPDGYLAYRGQPALWENLHAYLGRSFIANPATTA